MKKAIVTGIADRSRSCVAESPPLVNRPGYEIPSPDDGDDVDRWFIADTSR